MKPIALITGVSRKIGIGSNIARKLTTSGWDIALAYWRPYDESMPWGNNNDEINNLESELKKIGAKVYSIEADFSKKETPEIVINEIKENFGNISALILSHCHSVDSDIQSTTVESFDKHFNVNARATWLLIKYFTNQFIGDFGSGRIVSFTTGHIAGNLPYGASKVAMEKIVIASAEENRSKGITANVINPGATDTGWMNDDIKKYIKDSTFLNRIGQPEDCANLVDFLCSEQGKWINGQLLFSDGGVKY